MSKGKVLIKNHIILFIFNIMVIHNVYSQEVISGRLFDENSNGIPGINVTVKGTDIGTITDLDGNFELHLPSKDVTLIFSIVGYHTIEMKVSENSNFNLLVSEEYGIHQVYWCCTSHDPKPHCNSQKKVLKKNHSKKEVYIATIE